MESIETARPDGATEKQKAFLKALGVAFAPPELTKSQASELIEKELPKRPPTEKQITKLRRYGYLDDLDEDATALDASQLLEELSSAPPTDDQLARMSELGLEFADGANFQAGELDDILKLVDRKPSSENTVALKGWCGIERSDLNALHVNMLVDLALQYDYIPWGLGRGAVIVACRNAAKDVTVFKPRLTNCDPGGERFVWPESKMREWARRDEGNLEFSEQAVHARPDSAFDWRELGLAYVANQRFNEAVEALQQAIRLYPSAIDVRVYLGIVFLRTDRISDAEKVLADARKLDLDSFKSTSEALMEIPEIADLIRPYQNIFS